MSEIKIVRMVKDEPFASALIFVSVLISMLTFIYSTPLALVELVVTVAVSTVYIVTALDTRKKKIEYMNKIESSLRSDASANDRLSSFPLPIVLVNEKGAIEWFNSHFNDVLAAMPDVELNNITELIPNYFELISKDYFEPIELNAKKEKYTVYFSDVGDGLFALYFTEDTKLKDIRTTYFKNRPVAILLSIDLLEASEENFEQVDFDDAVDGVEMLIKTWFRENRCMFRQFATGKFFAVTEHENLEKLKAAKFNILDRVRNYRLDDRDLGITVSLGISHGSTLVECEKFAKRALTYAKDRGGDQAALRAEPDDRVDDDYILYGGTTDRKVKRTKVKSRVVAAMLDDLISASTSVFVIGHTFSDYDSIGAACGVASIAGSFSKATYVIVDYGKTMGKPLWDYLEGSEKAFSFISVEEALKLCDSNSLLVVVDTMMPENLLSGILEKGMRTVIIDHHRMAEDRISNEALLFVEPYASSASEMVTELIQYSSAKPMISKAVAEALLTGIYLDTKNFTLRVNVRTFEAATYLRERKADTLNIKKFFLSSVKENEMINSIISGAVFKKGIAIAVTDNTDYPEIRKVASLSADSLLNIEGVKAAFVVYGVKDTSFISARSYGEMNVQLVMENLGGGGHFTMAAARLDGTTRDGAVLALEKSIDYYYEKYC